MASGRKNKITCHHPRPCGLAYVLTWRGVRYRRRLLGGWACHHYATLISLISRRPGSGLDRGDYPLLGDARASEPRAQKVDVPGA